MTTETLTPATGFASEFTATEEEWRKAAEAALKGRPLDQIVRHSTIEGVPFDSITARHKASPIVGRAPGAPWIAMSRIDLGDPAQANAQALEDLRNGATGLSIVLAGPGGREGVVADTLDRLEATLDGVLLDLAPVHFEIPAFEGRTTAALVSALIERRGQKPGDVHVLFGLDLLRDLSRTGAMALPWEKMGARWAVTVKALLDRGFTAPLLMADQRPAHDAGASEAQELAGVLSSAVEHVRVLTANGLDAATVANTLSFALSADADQFATIAKLRAARLLWAAVRREFGLDDRPIHIHAQTSRRMMTRNDPQTNLVRTTIATFAAGVGGADSVTVLPYTAALGGSDADARRLARNAQSIVLEESNAYRVADPAAGAGAIEQLTDGLAEKAWSLFQQIERVGGLFAAMRSGQWQDGVRETREKRARAVATRKTAIVGVSEFPKPGERIPSVEQSARPDHVAAGARTSDVDEDSAEAFDAIVAAFLAGASTADIRASSKPSPSESARPLDLARLAEPFEALRAANEARSPRPKVFLALLGPIARHAARAGFVRNLLAAGGLEAVEGPADAGADEIAAAYGGAGAPVAVVCGADGDYAEIGAEAIAALKKRGAIVWLAGRPKDGRDALEAAGVTRFVAAGDDALEILADASAFGGPGDAKAAGGAR